MEYLAGFLIFFVGWLLLRFLLAATYASGFAEGALHVTHGGIERLGELARPIDAEDFAREFETEAKLLDRELARSDLELARKRAGGFGRELVSRSWQLRGLINSP